jgi:hypothetical protein
MKAYPRQDEMLCGPERQAAAIPPPVDPAERAPEAASDRVRRGDSPVDPLHYGYSTQLLRYRQNLLVEELLEGGVVSSSPRRSISIIVSSRMQSPARTNYVFKPRFVWPTRFSPPYTRGLDYVNYVSPVERVAFQKVLPRYMLATSQARDTGLGVSLENIQYFSRPEEAGMEAERRKPRSERHPYPHQRQFREYLTKWHIDVLA